MPRRDPDYVRVLKGKKPRVNPENQIAFPAAEGSTTEPPVYLDEFALSHWKRMVAILDRIQLFQDPTRDKLARYCQACADYEAVQEMRTKMGRYEEHNPTPENSRKLYFWMKALREYDSIMCDFEREYGLTPASAAKVRRPGEVLKPAEKVVDFIDSKPKVPVLTQ